MTENQINELLVVGEEILKDSEIFADKLYEWYKYLDQFDPDELDKLSKEDKDLINLQNRMEVVRKRIGVT
jgi:hypothetical protein